MSDSAAVVVAVDPDSAAERAGVLAGDRLLAINDLVPRDVIDVRADSATRQLKLHLDRGGNRVMLEIEKEEDEDLGLQFAQPVFDRMKTCNNACEFCFIRGLPRGLRRTLYVKDDDYRYSFLFGSFVTLTNLSDTEWRRILFQRLGPLRVSVHATDPELRRDLLANPKAPPILEQLDELGTHGIEVHAQVVLMPGRNDGAVLERTIADLADRYPGVQSVAVVPVGLTAHSRARRTRPLTADEANAAIDLVQSRQRVYRRRLGTGFVYGSDEMYLLAGRPFPRPGAYDDYPQLQNGVGLVPLFREEWRRAIRRKPTAVDPPLSICWATGDLMAPYLGELAEDLSSVSGLRVEVAAVHNTLFGGKVTVAGLVPGADIVASLAGRNVNRVILPRSMFDAEARWTIDGWTPQEIADRIGTPISIGAGARDLFTQTVHRQSRGFDVIAPRLEGLTTCAAS
jgi:putative radical SAM enzyme (TIGR03279 family)